MIFFIVRITYKICVFQLLLVRLLVNSRVFYVLGESGYMWIFSCVGRVSVPQLVLFKGQLTVLLSLLPQSRALCFSSQQDGYFRFHVLSIFSKKFPRPRSVISHSCKWDEQLKHCLGKQKLLDKTSVLNSQTKGDVQTEADGCLGILSSSIKLLNRIPEHQNASNLIASYYKARWSQNSFLLLSWMLAS